MNYQRALSNLITVTVCKIIDIKLVQLNQVLETAGILYFRIPFCTLESSRFQVISSCCHRHHVQILIARKKAKINVRHVHKLSIVVKLVKRLIGRITKKHANLIDNNNNNNYNNYNNNYNNNNYNNNKRKNLFLSTKQALVHGWGVMTLFLLLSQATSPVLETGLSLTASSFNR
jgi:hypothetical protein